MRITRAGAMKIATQVWGKGAAIRDRGPAFKTSAPGERERDRAELIEMRKAENKPELASFLDRAKYADTMTLGEFRALYQQSCAAVKAWRARESALQSKLLTYRYDVGTLFTVRSLGSGFSVKGSGDSWEEAFAKAGVTIDGIEQILHPRKAAAKRSVAKLTEEIEGMTE